LLNIELFFVIIDKLVDQFSDQGSSLREGHERKAAPYTVQTQFDMYLNVRNCIMVDRNFASRTQVCASRESM